MTNSIDLFSDPPPPRLDNLFDEFWSQYPRRVDKIAARKAFERVLKDRRATFQQLMVGVARYSHERMGEDPRFTKHPTTWLNAGAWENESIFDHASAQPKRGSVAAVMAGIDAFFDQEG